MRTPAKSHRSRWWPAVLMALTATACVPDEGGFFGAYIETAPPPLRIEARVSSPGPEYVWVPGYWSWGGADYFWTAGAWVRPAPGYHRWSPGRWKHRSHGWVWVAGYWH